MAYHIELTLRENEEYERIVNYIAAEFGYKKALEVEEDYFKIIQQIANNPFQFSLHNKKKNIRTCVISSQTTLYYRFDGELIYLLSFRSNFMNPRARNL
jgi:plasmid stabilization system protein ParE